MSESNTTSHNTESTNIQVAQDNGMDKQQVVNGIEESKSSSFLPILGLIILLIVLILGGGYYFLNQSSGQAILSKVQNSLGIMQDDVAPTFPLNDAPILSNVLSEKEEEIRRLQEALYQKEIEAESLATSLEELNLSVQEYQSRQDTINRLRYTIKPKPQIIAECFSMEVGRWEIPTSCLLSIATNVSEELQNDGRVVAFEVQGIVDASPYRGLSPELKQKGLAGFRAWSAIAHLYEKVPNATIFEGPSLQFPDRRGYSIKAYFVEE